MAARKAEAVENEMEAAVNENMKKDPVDPWGKMVTIKLPRPARGEENFLIASVNGRVFKIQKGVSVDVPEPIAECIEEMFEAEDAAEAYMESKEYK